MQHRTTVAGLAGALVLSALAIPGTAQADDASGDIRITKVVVNGGKDIVLGTTDVKTFTIAVTATDDSGILTGNTFPILWNTPLPNGDYYGLAVPTDIAGTCVRQSVTTTTCTHTLKINPRIHPQDNTTAGTWTVRAHVQANDGDYLTRNSAGKAKVLRNSRLTVNASPEPVKKNKTITVTGALTRANWSTYKYGGYTKQPVKLQFRKKGTSTYTTLKTVTTDSKGLLKTTTKATADGYFRYSFAGTSTTPAVTTAGDYVDVK
ncbi:calcium-binding protein [Streptomyces sp. CAI-121]|uniref:calcium-binding protein n=1 Tax=unclassified Streptomyces TaxID=2593676 RepID=UPI001587CDC8|nr:MULTISPECIES: calcium-binding protein [unclassified Streptomyces]NUV66757.1 calcium-binding protein [Streptomyces sp. CAI-121]NUW11561.1 calcium-binding protein [Streptomyces sp. CAI-68]